MTSIGTWTTDMSDGERERFKDFDTYGFADYVADSERRHKARRVAEQQLDIRTPPSMWRMCPSPRLFGLEFDSWDAVSVLEPYADDGISVLRDAVERVLDAHKDTRFDPIQGSGGAGVYGPT